MKRSKSSLDCPADSEVGDGIVAQKSSWRFDGNVPERFDRHVSRSIPGYDQGHGLVVEIAKTLDAGDGLIYELGCSTGVLTEKIAEAVSDRSFCIKGIDQVDGMLEIARKRCDRFATTSFDLGDITDYHFHTASMVVSYYTLQFVPVSQRPGTVNAIYKALQENGKLVLFEKITFANQKRNQMVNEAYFEYKREQGYSEAEIRSKAGSLEGVLVPQTEDQNIQMLKAAGFKNVETMFAKLCWQGYLATK